jgi:hypothetical protein
MTKGKVCLIFCATSFAFTKYSYFIRLLNLFSLHFPCLTNQPNQLGNSHTLFNFLSTVSLPCLLYTLSISNFVICLTRFYRVTNASELNKVSKPSQNEFQFTEYSDSFLINIMVEFKLS